MSDQSVTIDLEFPSNMVLDESIDIGERLEMMRDTKSGFNTFSIMWEYVDFAVLGALLRREYRDLINAYYAEPKNPNREAITYDGQDSVGVEIRCINTNTNDETGNTIGTFRFEDPKLALIIKLAAKTPKDQNSF